MRILFLTTNNLATNPRLYKEVQLLSKGQNCIEIICFEFDNWSKEINEGLKKQVNGLKIVTIRAGRKPFFPWLWSVITETCFRFLGKFFSLPVPALSQAVSRRSNLLIKAITKNKISQPDWVIGHNPGAMWPTLKAAKKFNCKAGFDVEDYHPGEGDNKHLQHLTKRLMAELLPKMNYVSFAAPLILQQVKRDIKAMTGNWFTVLNYFPGSDFIEPITLNDGPVKLVWFSQNISAGRGIELILPFLKTVSGKLELHLLGNLDPEFYKNHLINISNIIIHPPIEQKELHHTLAKFDIGLALDIPLDKNRDLAITNKLIAYLQSGLYVVATSTIAQEFFLKELPDHGQCFDYRANNVEVVFEKIFAEINIIRRNKIVRYKNFGNRNWETTSVELINTWNI